MPVLWSRGEVGRKQRQAEMKEKDQNTKATKGTYKAPEVVRVSLRPEEAVLGHCKVTGSAGAASAGCHTPVACRTQGS